MLGDASRRPSTFTRTHQVRIEGELKRPALLRLFKGKNRGSHHSCVDDTEGGGELHVQIQRRHRVDEFRRASAALPIVINDAHETLEAIRLAIVQEEPCLHVMAGVGRCFVTIGTSSMPSGSVLSSSFSKSVYATSCASPVLCCAPSRDIIPPVSGQILDDQCLASTASGQATTAPRSIRRRRGLRIIVLWPLPDRFTLPCDASSQCCAVLLHMAQLESPCGVRLPAQFPEAVPDGEGSKCRGDCAPGPVLARSI